MKRYTILFAKQAKRDVALLSPKLRKKLQTILQDVIAMDPYVGKRLSGDLAGCYSYRLSYQDHIVYEIHEYKVTVFILRVRTHYGD